MSINSTHQRIQIVQESLRVVLPKEYAKFLEEVGYYNGEYYEVFGYLENFEDIEAYPCVIGMTHIYAKDNPLIKAKDLVIHFDEYLNSVVVLSCEDGGVYNIDFQERKQIFADFKTWFEDLKRIEREVNRSEIRF